MLENIRCRNDTKMINFSSGKTTTDNGPTCTPYYLWFLLLGTIFFSTWRTLFSFYKFTVLRVYTAWLLNSSCAAHNLEFPYLVILLRISHLACNTVILFQLHLCDMQFPLFFNRLLTQRTQILQLSIYLKKSGLPQTLSNFVNIFFTRCFDVVFIYRCHVDMLLTPEVSLFRHSSH